MVRDGRIKIQAEASWKTGITGHIKAIIKCIREQKRMSRDRVKH